jgi:hypothetical protein
VGAGFTLAVDVVCAHGASNGSLHWHESLHSILAAHVSFVCCGLVLLAGHLLSGPLLRSHRFKRSTACKRSTITDSTHDEEVPAAAESRRVGLCTDRSRGASGLGCPRHGTQLQCRILVGTVPTEQAVSHAPPACTVGWLEWPGMCRCTPATRCRSCLASPRIATANSC